MNSNLLKKKGAKNGTIVLLHGNSSSSKVFESIFNSELPYNLAALDLIGHGESEHTGSYTIADYKKQILSVIGEIEGDILLVGNSLGGHLALEIANEIPKLKGLLIFGTPPVKKPLNMEEAFLPTTALNTFFTENPSLEEIDASLHVAAENKSVIPILKEDFLRTDPKIRSVFALDLGNLSDESEIFVKLPCKKFIIKGDKDPSVNPQYLETINSLTNFELITMKECGHYPSLEKPDEFAQHLQVIASKVFDS